MSLTQSFYLAHSARRLLAREAAKADHDLRRLVGHANLLDGLMIDIADAEREQESWFNQSVSGAAKAEDPKRTVQWADTVRESAVEDDSDEEREWDADSSDDDSDDEDVDFATSVSLRRPAPTITTVTEIEDEDMEEDDENTEDLALTRTPSSQPPELMHEDSDSSEDESMPPSPPTLRTPADSFSEKQRKAIATTSFYESQSSLAPSEQESFFDEGYYLPQRQSTVIVGAA